jgi:quercetin dioxygenase-like cupin family protein
MFVSHRDEIKGKRLTGDAVKNVTKQVLIGAEQGWEDYVMRLFTVEPGGFSPRHAHDWPHIIYIVEGEGLLYIDGTDYPVRAGSVAFVTGGLEHQLTQKGDKNFVFMCIVPKEGDV